MPKCMRATINQIYITIFYKHYSNVYVVDYIMQVVDYGITNLVESPHYDLGCEKIIGDLVVEL